MKRKAAGALYGERGANLVEMALVTGLLLVLVAGAVDLGRAFHSYIVVTNAAREGARYGSRFPWDAAGIQAAVQQEATASGVTLTSILVECRTVPNGGIVDCNLSVSGYSIIVTVNKTDYISIFGPIPVIGIGAVEIGPVTMVNSAEMVIFGDLD